MKRSDVPIHVYPNRGEEKITESEWSDIFVLID